MYIGRANSIKLGIFGMILLSNLQLAVWAVPYTLSVTNGSQSGSYESGSGLNIWADPGARGAIFDHWTGDVSALDDVNAAHTTLIMPSANVNLTATYKATDSWIPTDVIAYFPATVDGVIFMFHGTGGGAATLIGDAETQFFIKTALTHNYGVIALTSTDRVNKQWDTSSPAASNPDMQNVAAVRNFYISRGQISATDKVFVFGVSNGSNFSSMLAQAAPSLGFTVSATNLNIDPGDGATMAVTHVPTIWTVAQHDSQIMVSQAQNNYSNFINNGGIGQFHINVPTPVYPLRFWRIPYLTDLDSQAIYTSLKVAGYLDVNDYLTIDPLLTTAWEKVIPSTYTSNISDIQSQLNICFTEHTVFSDFTNVVLDFFNQPTTLISNAPTVTSFSPTHAKVGATITLTGTNFTGITSVTFGGVVAPLSSVTFVSSSSIKVPVPVGAVSGVIKVANSVGTATSSSAFVVDAPIITSFSPASAAIGANVTITGTYLLNATSVKFGNNVAVLTSNSDTSIRTTVPVGTTSGPITITTASGTGVSSTAFVVALPPTLASFSPTSGAIGTVVTIIGSHFIGATAVTIAGKAMPFTVNDDTAISATIPPGAGTGTIKVTTPGGSVVSATRFTVTP